MKNKILILSVIFVLANVVGFVDVIQSTYINYFTSYGNYLLTFIFAFAPITLGKLLTKLSGKNVFVYSGYLVFAVYFILYFYWKLYLGSGILLLGLLTTWGYRKNNIKFKKNKNKTLLCSTLALVLIVITLLLIINAGENNSFAKKLAEYDSNPPTSGKHDETFFPEKIVYSEPIAPEFQVHILDPHEISKAHLPVQNSGEEGKDLVKAGILLQYNCDCPEIVEELTRIALDYKPRIIVAPWPYMEEKIAITARSKIEKFDGVDEIKIRKFIEKNFNRYDEFLECLKSKEKIKCAENVGYI